MIRRLLTAPYRWWLRQDLKWIRDCMADERDRHAQYNDRMRGLQREEAELLWKLEGPTQRVVSLLPRDRVC